ncbi:type II-A CRISPR-associated protein Csn2 [Thiospirochaeta perfilievii]|uniref:Type II-A CRISPR-associated protein Csn2 n=1 Tax=Thiospirochaeta perfilievii TaxID=252967 RepID=A0A5C1QDJ8_9SPIO|nr:type II-A CRISPR-associated protein Csn2 [Thiospirochaeta perfilievii]QEN04726.1 type II-A CRISPR-associated protein Csn2 [Thiospirochaeta perfilievii]
MISFKISNFDELQFNDNLITLEIHNKQLYRNIIESFKAYVASTELKENIIFFENSKSVNWAKKIVICNPESIEYEMKNIQKKLITIISEELYSDIEFLSKLEVNYSTLIEQIEGKIIEHDIDLVINSDFTPDKFLKFVNLNIKLPDSGILSQLYQYVDVVTELNLYEVVVFTNIKLFLDSNELLELFKYIIYKKLNCILLENISNDIIDYETKLVIESDFNDYTENPSTT